jgi:potassium/hydrogen antiporter
MSVATSYILFIAGGALLAAFLADVVARRVGVPDILLLLAVGIVVGRILVPKLSPSDLTSFLQDSGYLGTAALGLILFSAGLDLRPHEMEGVPAQAILLALVSVSLSMLLTFPLAYLYLTPHSVLLSLIFAAALSCTSSAVVVPVASRMSLPSRARSLVHLSSALEDTFAIIVTTTLMLVAVGPSSSSLPLPLLLALPLPLGVVGGFAAGLFWIEMTRRYQTWPFFSMATVGFLFFVIGGIQSLGGSGILSALVFGVMLGNAPAVRKWLHWRGDVVLLPQVRQFQSELAYLLRAFFMLLLGMLVVLSYGAEDLLVVGLAITAVLLVARATSIETFLRVSKSPRSWNLPLSALGARGLTSAVLVFLPIAAGLLPSADTFLDPTAVVVVATVLVTTVGVLLYEHVPSIHEGRFLAPRPPRRPLSDEERRALYVYAPAAKGGTRTGGDTAAAPSTTPAPKVAVPASSPSTSPPAKDDPAPGAPPLPGPRRRRPFS